MAQIEKMNEQELDIEEQMKSFMKDLQTKDKLVSLALFNIYQDRKQLDKELSSELNDLYYDYYLKGQPLTQNINDLINAQRQLNEEELKNMNILCNDKEILEMKDIQIEEIPDFWVTAIKNCKYTGKICNKNDLQILQFLKKIEIEESKESSDIKINFTFVKNEYFDQEKLFCKISIKSEDDETPEKLEATVINWTDGKDPTKKLVKKKQKNKKTGQERIVNKMEDVDSFFSIFDNISSNVEDEEEKQDILEKLEDILEIISFLKEEVVAYSLGYYLNIQRIEDEDDEDLEQIEEDENEDSENDQEKKKVLKIKKKKSSNAENQN